MDNFEEELLDMVEKMPAFPKSVEMIIRLSSDINCDHKELVKVIEHDPVMTLKVLNLVNSAYFGLSNKITSINHAVVYVGLNTVKNLAISIASIGMLPGETEAGLNMGQFLYHSISSSSLAKLLAKHMGAPDKVASDFFVAGLLHDFGKIVLAQCIPEEYKKVLQMEGVGSMELVDAEKEIIGVDHTQVGVLLGQKWNLSPNLIESIKLHHTGMPSNDEDNKLLINTIFIANKLSKELEKKEKIKSFSDELVNDCVLRLGSDIEDCLASPEKFQEEISKALLYMRL